MAKHDLLAIDGGVPVRTTLLPYGHQSLSEEDIQAVVSVLRSDWLTTGPKIDQFEEAFAAYVGAKHAVSFSSGTAALHGAAFAAGLRAGDEVITTPMTFAATANCILYQRARPIFVDVCADTLNIDPEQIGRSLNGNTRAIIAVDYAGHPADLDEIIRLADRQGLTLIEDASHALGAHYRERRVGSIAHMTTFSFHPVKHLTTGEGGMVTTDRADFAETLRRFRNHGISRDARLRHVSGEWHYEMVLLGFNYRLTDIACALGLGQLKRIEENLSRRRRIAERYSEAFFGLPGIQVPVERESVRPAWHLYPVRFCSRVLKVSRSTIFRALRAENMGVNVHYIPVHLHPYYREKFGYKGGEFPIVEDAYEKLISLPMFHGMSDADVEDVISAVSKTVRHFAGEAN